jgi:hypothetical protein
MAKQFVKHSASIGVVVGLLTIALPITPTSASTYVRRSGFVSERSYRECAADLLQSGLSPEVAATGCSEALSPRELGRCVTRISREQDGFAQNAFTACRQVRRPVELSTCFVLIRNELEDTTAANVLDNCRRSLLPDRYSDCVLGISRATDLASTTVLNACISGADYPRDFGSILIPAGAIDNAPADVPPAETPPVESPAPEAAPQSTPSPNL